LCISEGLKKENGDRNPIIRLLTVLEKAVMQYSRNTIKPAVNRGDRLFGLQLPNNSPNAPKNKVTRKKEIANRKNSPNENPGLNSSIVTSDATR
jgi:hypothetical protein